MCAPALMDQIPLRRPLRQGPQLYVRIPRWIKDTWARPHLSFAS